VLGYLGTNNVIFTILVALIFGAVTLQLLLAWRTHQLAGATKKLVGSLRKALGDTESEGLTSLEQRMRNLERVVSNSTLELSDLAEANRRLIAATSSHQD